MSLNQFLTDDWTATWVDANRVGEPMPGEPPPSRVTCPCCLGKPAGTGQYRATQLCDSCYQKAVRMQECVHR